MEGAGLALDARAAFGFATAANAELLPKLKPRALREHFVVPSIGSGNIAGVERPDVRRFEHFLQLLNLVDDAFNVHSVSLSRITVEAVKWSGTRLRDFGVTLRHRPLRHVGDRTASRNAVVLPTLGKLLQGRQFGGPS